jgi:hypothetical protein
MNEEKRNVGRKERREGEYIIIVYIYNNNSNV